MSSKTGITRLILMDKLMQERPETVFILLQNKMHCVGCLLAPFHNIADAAIEHGMDEDVLISALRAATENDVL